MNIAGRVQQLEQAQKKSRKPRITLSGIYTDDEYEEEKKKALANPERYRSKVIRIDVVDMSVNREEVLKRIKEKS